MSKIIEICIAKKKGDKLINVVNIEARAGKGLVGDRKFKENNNKKQQLTLIEIENINYFNKISRSSIPAINFRRNIITQGVSLNDLNGKIFRIGSVKVRAHDLCHPCKYLQDILKFENLIKVLLNKSGLRCEILTDGKLSIGDVIQHND